jgi:hypothetical protein
MTRRNLIALLCLLLAALLWAGRAEAIGWGPMDFLIAGGPSFSTKIGVFDPNLTFKGYLDNNIVTVGGMDFDGTGNLAAVRTNVSGEVRVYAPSGTQVGGFVRSDNLLGSPGDLKVLANGDYIIATQNFGGGDGAREFAPDGTFVRQYGSGDITSAVVVPGNHLWIGGIGSSVIKIFDLGNGAQIGSFSVTGMGSAFSMSYSRNTNTVLSVSQSKVWELDRAGNLLRTFDGQGNVLSDSVIRGPNGDVFATTGGGQSVLRWHSDSMFVGSTSTASSVGGTAAIVWAGNIPEPATNIGVLAAALILCVRVIGRRKS